MLWLQPPANDDGASPALVALLARAASRVRLVEAATPTNLEAEVVRLAALRRRGEVAEPAFAYADTDLPDGLSEALSALAEDRPASSWIGQKARELALEAALVRAVGRPDFARLAARRYRSTAEDDARATRWSELSAPDEPLRDVISDDEADAGSLVSAMRRAIGERRLPIRVVVKAEMCPLSATGDGVIYVARGRRLSARAVARTVCHEIEGHVLPLLARREVGVTLRRAGDADDEEGRAVAAEARAGFLDRSRKKELGLRHVAAMMAHDGARFDDIADALERRQAAPEHAVRIATRALRGGGLGRERVYLAAYFRVRDHAERR